MTTAINRNSSTLIMSIESENKLTFIDPDGAEQFGDLEFQENSMLNHGFASAKTNKQNSKRINDENDNEYDAFNPNTENNTGKFRTRTSEPQGFGSRNLRDSRDFNVTDGFADDPIF